MRSSSKTGREKLKARFNLQSGKRTKLELIQAGVATPDAEAPSSKGYHLATIHNELRLRNFLPLQEPTGFFNWL
jgi:hypothetical protein